MAAGRCLIALLCRVQWTRASVAHLKKNCHLWTLSFASLCFNYCSNTLYLKASFWQTTSPAWCSNVQVTFWLVAEMPGHPTVLKFPLLGAAMSKWPPGWLQKCLVIPLSKNIPCLVQQCPSDSLAGCRNAWSSLYPKFPLLGAAMSKLPSGWLQKCLAILPKILIGVAMFKCLPGWLQKCLAI